MNWRIGVSSGACHDRPILDLLPALLASGARGIEVGTPPRHFDPWQDHQVVELNQRLRDADLPAISIHAPFGRGLDLASPNPDERQAGIAAILNAAMAISRLGGALVVVHPSDLVRHEHDAPARLNDCADSLRVLARRLRESGETLVLETPLPHLIGGHPDEFAWLLRTCDDGMRVCLDTGHAALGHHWHRLLDVAGPRLVHVHANDTRGHRDDHLPPGDGIIHWTEIGRSLRAAQFDGWVMLELQCPPADAADYFRRARERTAVLLGDV